jgi:hypothetical protein
VLRWEQVGLRPFVPSPAVSGAGDRFRDGVGSSFSNFSTLGDFGASLFWDIRGLGPTDRGMIR